MATRIINRSGVIIVIESEPNDQFYITAEDDDGRKMYDGYAPRGVYTMNDAVKEALESCGLS